MSLGPGHRSHPVDAKIATHTKQDIRPAVCNEPCDGHAEQEPWVCDKADYFLELILHFV